MAAETNFKEKWNGFWKKAHDYYEAIKGLIEDKGNLPQDSIKMDAPTFPDSNAAVPEVVKVIAPNVPNIFKGSKQI